MHITQYIEALNLPKELIVLILAAMPISELRGAIPLAIGKFGFSPIKAYSIAVLGNALPVIPLLLFLDKASKLLMKNKLGEKFFTWWFKRARKHSNLVERFEAIGLILFVAIPLPVTGAWTASVAAYLFSIRFLYAFPCIITGILLAGVVVTVATLGVIASI